MKFFCKRLALALALLLFFSAAPEFCHGFSAKGGSDFTYFEGKTWLVIGDSISEHNNRAAKNYDQFAAEWLGVKVINIAKSGTGYLQSYGKNPGWVSNLSALPARADFITVMGGLNDTTYPLGSFEDRGTDTFYGALHTFYQALMEKYPDTPIGVITSPPRADCHGEEAVYACNINAVIEVAQYYGLPVLDLYRDSGLLPWESDHNKEYFSSPRYPAGDGTHPNEKGQRIIADQVYGFIRQSLRPMYAEDVFGRLAI